MRSRDTADNGLMLLLPQWGWQTATKSWNCSLMPALWVWLGESMEGRPWSRLRGPGRILWVTAIHLSSSGAWPSVGKGSAGFPAVTVEGPLGGRESRRQRGKRRQGAVNGLAADSSILKSWEDFKQGGTCSGLCFKNTCCFLERDLDGAQKWTCL